MSDGHYREIIDGARQAAARIDADQGMIDPDDRQFTVGGDLNQPGSLTLRRRPVTSFERYSLFPGSHLHQTPVTNLVPQIQGSAQSMNTTTTTDDLLVVTDTGRLVGQLRLAITADDFHQLLLPTRADSTVSQLQIVSTEAGSIAVFDAAETHMTGPWSSASPPNRHIALTTPGMMPTPALPTTKKLAQKSKDWTKAVEKPTGATKAEADSCLTCIQYNRNCTGTNLVWIHGEYRCEKCAEKRTSTGSRKCLWKDPANTSTYKEAQAAAGLKGLWANTAAGIAARKARKADQIDQAYDLKSEEEEKTENKGDASTEEDSEVDLDDAAEAAWQDLFRDVASGLELDLDVEVEILTVLETMKVLYEGVVEEGQGKAVQERRWRPEVVTALETRLETEIKKAQTALNRALDIRSASATARVDQNVPR